MKPLVSIAMGVYNSSKTLKNAIDSIIKQTYDNWEFIICDDCSTDNTYAILKKYAQQDHRFKILHNKSNMGLAAGLNRCLSIATGKYFARMDDDDISLPDRLSVEVEYLETHPMCDIVGTNIIVTNDKKNLGTRHNVSELTATAFLNGSPFFHPTIMMKTSVLKKLGGYNTKVYRTEDLELWFRLYQNGYHGSNLNCNLYKYHESIADYKKRNLKGGIAAFHVFWTGYREIGIPLYQRWRAIKPIVSSILPRKIMYKYHMHTLRNKNII